MEEIISEPIQFEWDKGNIDKSIKKHGVTNDEAEQIFINKPTVFLESERHLTKEKRYIVLGKSEHGKLLSVIFTIRNIKVRIISARAMSKKERRLYAHKESN